jgi:hypothetical protein
MTRLAGPRFSREVHGEGAVHAYGADDDFMFKAEIFDQAKGRLDELNATKRGRRASGSSAPPRARSRRC